ncbi:MAG: NhaC family Na+:H+ antiporter [Woeseiaceae bacterium]|jgi:NhaC family Na+:H+ antiporter
MQPQKRPTIAASLIVCFGTILILITGIVILEIGVHALLILALLLTGAYSYSYGYTTVEMIDGMKDSLGRATPAMVIFLLIGTIMGSWIHSGTVPALIYYGLEFVNAQYFLPMGLIICSMTSLATGTSWGTVGTVGLALMGIGISLGISPPLIAGMIISGAYFGDKLSPISDTTNLAAASAETNIYDHIVAMLYTTVPAYVICLVIYTIMGFGSAADTNIDLNQVTQIQSILDEKFNLSLVVMLPIVALLVMMMMKVSAIPAMIAATFLATIISLVFQGSNLTDALTAINYGYTEESGVELVDAILLRGGIQSMMWTFSLAYLALCLGGVLEKVGYLTVLVEKIVEKISSAANLVTLVICTTFLSNVALGTNYMSIILNGNVYREVFDKAGLKRRMLSRLLEEGGTQTAALIPWSTAGAFMAGTLGVATFAYVPYTLLNYINPLLSIVLAYMGIFIFRVTLDPGDSEKLPTSAIAGEEST